MIDELDYLYEKHLQEDAEEPDFKEILEWSEKLAEDLPPMEADDDPEWGMCYHEDLR